MRRGIRLKLLQEYHDSFELRTSNWTIREDETRAGQFKENPVTNHVTSYVADMYEFIFKQGGISDAAVEKAIQFAKKKGHAWLNLYCDYYMEDRNRKWASLMEPEVVKVP